MIKNVFWSDSLQLISKNIEIFPKKINFNDLTKTRALLENF